MASTPFSKLYDVEVVGGDQRQRMAELLRSQGLNQPQGQMVSGWYVPPSWSQNLNSALQLGLGTYMGIKGEEDERKNMQEDIQRFTAMQQAKALRATQPTTPTQQATTPAYQSTPAQGQVQDGEFKLMKTGGTEGMQSIPSYSMAQPQPQQVDPYDYSQYKSPRFQRMLQQQQLEQLTALPEYGTTPVETANGLALVSKTGEVKYLTNAQGKPLYKENINELVVRNPETGVAQLNPLALQGKSIVARSGASNQTVINAGPKALNTKLGTDIGENIFTARNQAQKAFASNTQLDTIQNALPNAIVGTGANARVDLARLGETLGVGGKTNEERLRNTGALMQGLAQNELNAAEMMKGQGQITENERNIIRKAAAGEVAMTAPELTSLNTALRKINNYKISLHQQNVDILKQDPNARELYPYVAAPLTGFPTEVPQAQGQQPVNVAPRPGARFKGYVNPTGTR